MMCIVWYHIQESTVIKSDIQYARLKERKIMYERAAARRGKPQYAWIGYAVSESKAIIRVLYHRDVENVLLISSVLKRVFLT